MGNASLSSAKILIGRYLLQQTEAGGTHFTTDELAAMGGLEDRNKVSGILRENFPGIFKVKQGGNVELNGLLKKHRDENVEYLKEILTDLQKYAEMGENTPWLTGEGDSHIHRTRWR